MCSTWGRFQKCQQSGTYHGSQACQLEETNSTRWFRKCVDAGISGNKTNHSLRATGASQLFQANVPEKVIQERTGHRSLEALWLYEKTTTEQHQAVAQVLGSSATLSYESVIQKQQELSVSPRPPYIQAAPTLNMSGCTVNICFNPPPPPPPPPPILEFTAEELDELFRPM